MGRINWEFVDFRAYCVNTVGEALMPPVGHCVFAAMLRKTVTFYRREASMPPLQQSRTALRLLTHKHQFISIFRKRRREKPVGFSRLRYVRFSFLSARKCIRKYPATATTSRRTALEPNRPMIHPAFTSAAKAIAREQIPDTKEITRLMP